MADTAVKRLRDALRLSKRGSIVETKRQLIEIAEHQGWKELGFESFPHFLLSGDGLAVRDTDTAEFVKGILQDGFVDLWVQTLDEIAVSRKKPRAKRPLGVERFWKLGTGNDQDRLLLRLYREKPGLYGKVVKGQLSLMAAAIEAGWRTQAKPGRPETRKAFERIAHTIPLAKDELMAKLKQHFAMTTEDEIAGILGQLFQWAPAGARVRFVQANIPGADAARAAKGADNVIDAVVIDEGKMIAHP